MSASNRRRRIRGREGQKRLADYVATHAVVAYEVHAKLKQELERVSAVLADLLEEQRGAAVPAREIVTWVKNPEAVSFLLQGYVTDRDGGCDNCGSYGAHRRNCDIAAAWRTIGDPRGVADIDLAHEEALWMGDQMREARRIGPPIEVVSSPFVREGEAYLIQPGIFSQPLPPLFQADHSTYDLWRGNMANQPILSPSELLRLISTGDLASPVPRNSMLITNLADDYPDPEPDDD